MPIPDFDGEGVLPAGLHDATLGEIEERFGSFNGSDVRVQLFERLVRFLEAVGRWGNVDEVLIDGSFATRKERPSDIDIILVYRAGFDFGSEVVPEEYNLINRKRARRTYGFDVIPVAADSSEREKWLGYFGADTKSGVRSKGLVRVHQ